METVAKTSNLVKSNEVIGVDVINTQNENLGKIYEIVIDKLSGQVSYAVLESGSFLGMGGKFFAIPWKSLKYNTDENSFQVTLTKDQVKNSPGFDKNNWPKGNDNTFWTQTTDYYRSM